jgi:hypothetical protein
MTNYNSSSWFGGLHNAKKTTTMNFQLIVVVLEGPKKNQNDKLRFVFLVSKLDGMRKKP